uniref:Selenoprotein V n=1 Tax=Cricetulus griseus TaxID=10029 RepID=A0A8C2N0Y8_CRIGR
MNNRARIPAPSPARATRATRATRTPIPVRTATPVRARIPAPVRTSTRVPATPPIRFPTPAPAPGPTPAPAWSPVLAPTPAPARSLAPAPTPAPAWSPAPAPTPAPPSSSRPASSLLKEEPSTYSLGEVIHGPLPGLSDTGVSKTSNSDYSPPQLEEASNDNAPSTLGPTLGPIPGLPFLTSELKEAPGRNRLPSLSPSSSFISTKEVPSTSENFPATNRILIRVYILLKKTLEHHFPNLLEFEEERATRVTGEFEVFVEGKLVHSKKKGDGFVDESSMKKLRGVIDEEIKKR